MLMLFALVAQLAAFTAFALASPRYRALLTRGDRSAHRSGGAGGLRAGATAALAASLAACCVAVGPADGLVTFVGIVSLAILAVIVLITLRRPS